MKQKPYKGTINEFVDWISGINSVTGLVITGVDEDHPISGESIRKLLLKKLKTPFITDVDNIAGKVRFFSSEEAKTIWESYYKGDSPTYDPEKAEEFVLYSMDLPATYAITGLDVLGNTRYIIEGNSSSSNAILQYTLGLRDSLGGNDSDAVTVTYTITDSSGNITYNEKYLIDTDILITKSIYQYLRSGDNTLSITAVANNHNARTTKTIHIYLVAFLITSNFTGYYLGIGNNRPISFDVSISRSITNLPIETNVYISEVGEINQIPVSTWRYTDTGSTPSHSFSINGNYEASDYNNSKKYRMIIKASMGDAESQVSFDSNVLIYEFEVASNLGDLSNAFVNCAYSIQSANYTYTNEGKPILLATQYVPFNFDWGYYTDDGSQLSDIDWYLRTGNSENYTYYNLVSILGVKGTKPTSLNFIPSIAMNYENDNSYLIAKIGNDIIEEFPINIAQNIINVVETGNYSLKLSAYGKTNSSESKNTWVDSENNITTTFSSGVVFDNQNGWDDNSLVLKGLNSYAIINYCPFPETLDDNTYIINQNGCAFEIDFKPESVDNDNDIILTIGDPTKGRITVTPNSAIFYDGSNAQIIKTNIKSGERVKLCFIFNKYSSVSNDSNLIYIVNNGILERAAVMSNNFIKSSEGNIKIGGSKSGIRVYSIRAYRHDITPKQELENYMFDNISNTSLISRNDIYGNSGSINYAGMSGKQDIIIIEGDLSNILNNAQAKENATVTIKRESNIDSSKDFTITNCRIRNHGLSTLSYPITSMKVWFNKSNLFYEDLLGVLLERIPEFICPSLSYLGLNKNRYIMKTGSIPSNKFVLQANYADSSGAHNGALLRLINDTWYNAQFGDNNLFKLRTAPLLFASGAKITHDNIQLNEDGSWVEGLYNILPGTTGYVAERAGKTWPEITNTQFPYQIRNAADSFPCVIFYRDTSTQELNLQLLGLYVFMDDKKSDFVYGERSIYYSNDPTDPFCLKTANKKQDTKANKVWDNEKVLQIEVVYPNSPLTSYSSKTIADSYELDENDNLIPSPGAIHRFDDVLTTDTNGNTTSYYWEQHFELIYPDKEDITDSNNNFSSSKFVLVVTPFMNFLDWITDVALLKNTGSVLGASGSLARVTQAELNKFIAEAHDHLDLYKLAAYYIFYLRFGLIDSVERNAQLKTYDGLHFHYEPWDMDIALGGANNGVIAYDPPLTRDTKAGGSTYAFSGRTATQSNVLWDCLECWDYWANTLVPEVAQALYDAGLTYENASKMFDEEYVNKWSETLYNESGHYKYIDATVDPKYRLYLNGARTSHRHWWLSKSMNYYDAKWSCGNFTKRSINFRIGKNLEPSGYNLIKIYPTNTTFFKVLYGTKGSESGITPIGDLVEATTEVGGEAIIDANIQLEDKLPCFIFGASSIEGLDLSGLLTSATGNLGRGYTDISFGESYDDVLGASLKWLKLGAPCTPNIYNYPNENTYISNLSIGLNGIGGTTENNLHDALENIELLDVIGWWNKLTNLGVANWISDLFSGNGYDRKNIKTLYAMGCNMATGFKTSNSGNKFTDVRLPSSVTSLEFINSSWEDISFWETTSLTDTRAQYDKIQGIPASVNSVSFKGSTAKNLCSLDFILSWIDNIEAEISIANPGYTSEELEEALYVALSLRVLYAEQINWGTGTTKIYYKDLIRLSKFNKDGILDNLKGYIVISDLTPLTASQLSEILNIFGDYVFSVGTTNNNLVVDLNLGFVRISVIGEKINNVSTISVINDELYLNEPKRANLRATSFSLKAEQATNAIINVDYTYSDFENEKPNNVYLWTISDSESDTSTINNTYKSARLEKRNDGSIRIATTEGDYGDYYLYINVYYFNEDQLLYDSVKINIVGVTYPTGYEFTFSRTNNPRLFLYNSLIASDLFGATYASLNPLPNAYVLTSRNLLIEISINPTGTYTATLNNIEFNLSDLDPVYSTNYSGFISKDELCQSDNTLYWIGDDSNIAYTKDGVNGLVLLINGDAPTNMKKYKVTARISIGGKNSFNKTLTIILWDDSSVIIPLNVNNGVYNAIVDLYNFNYSLSNLGRSIYKSDLLSLYGTLDFSLYNNLISSLLTSNGDSVFLYTKYITGINLLGCTSVTLLDSLTNATELDFSNINNLLTLNLYGCLGLSGELDLTSSSGIQSLDTRNTNVGIKLVNSTITSLLLGSPTSLVITNPTTLGNSGTTFTIQSDNNLTSLELNEINTTNVHTFSIFNTILSS